MENKEEINNEDITQVIDEEGNIVDLEKKELDDLTDRLKRVMAEFENYKKRSTKERDQLHTYITATIVTGLLPIIDNLEKAVGAETKDESYKQGIELVYKNFLSVMASFGVEEIDSKKGTAFDPEYHEAVSHIENSELGSNIISEEFRKGYKIGNKVIRHSMVVVAN